MITTSALSRQDRAKSGNKRSISAMRAVSFAPMRLGSHRVSDESAINAQASGLWGAETLTQAKLNLGTVVVEMQVVAALIQALTTWYRLKLLRKSDPGDIRCSLKNDSERNGLPL
jgi:hypothetical protein